MGEIDSADGKKGEPAKDAEEPGKTREDSSLDASGKRVKTVQDALALWGKTVVMDASPSASIKAGRIRARLESASKLLPSLRRVSKAGEPKDEGGKSDFELLKLLGKGGMGMVFLARQESLDREIAVKMIQPQSAEDAEARAKFFAEAMVTGELDHPNIVPVYDFGGTPEGLLFYPMKRVRGRSWDEVIEEKSLEDNLTVLLSVCDAVAFAHDKGVIHRDLKPDNVMLGDYGEVFVMDWGLAVSGVSEKAEPLTEDSGFGGTPAYMAPEMANCDLTKIGPSSDIYLLGGILYEIVTGLRPHAGKNVYACIRAAAQNIIQTTDKKGELVEVALKAMATEPGDRYRSAKEFQRAVRDYRSHAESLKLSAAAEERLSGLGSIDENELYRECTEIIAGYQQAMELWRENESAVTGLRRARETFVEIALGRGDLALAKSQVAAIEGESRTISLGQEDVESFENLAGRVGAAITEAERKERMARFSRRGLRVAGVATALLATTALILFFNARAARLDAEAKRMEADAARGTAEDRRKQAEAERDRADRQTQIATVQRLAAQSQSVLAEFPDRSVLLAVEAVKAAREYGVSPYAAHQALRDAIAGCGGSVLTGHKGWANAIAVSSDNRWLVTGSSDATARVWDLTAEDPSKTGIVLRGHKRRINAVAISPDNRWVVTGSFDGTARLWDLTTKSPCKTPIVVQGDGVQINTVAIGRNSRWLVTGSSDATVRLWDLSAEDPSKASIALPIQSRVMAMAMSRDGRWLATGTADGIAQLWDLTAGDPSRTATTLRGEDGAVGAVAMSADNRWLVTGSESGIARLWNLAAEDPSKASVALPAQSPVMAVAMSADNRWLVTKTKGGTARLWDLTAQDPSKASIALPVQNPVTDVAMSADNRWLATGSKDGTAYLWDLTAKDPSKTAVVLRRHRESVTALSISPDNHWLVTGSCDSTACLWDLTAKDPSKTAVIFQGHEHPVIAVAISPDEHWLATGSFDGTARLWDLSAKDPSKIGIALRGHESWVTAVAISPDNHWLVTGSFDGTARLWDLTVEDPSTTRTVLKGHKERINAVAVSPDNRWLVTGSSDRTARLWDLAAEDPSRTAIVLQAGQSVNDLTISPDNRWLVSNVGVWDLATKVPSEVSINDGVGLEGLGTAVATSPDSHWLVTARSDLAAHFAVLSDLTARDPFATGIVLRGHESPIGAVAISPDSHYLVTGGWDSTARLWDLTVPDPSRTVAVVRGHEGRINAVAISSDSRWLVTGSSDRTACLWDLTAEDPSKTAIVLRGHEGPIYALDVGRSDRWLVTGSADGTARLWNLRLDELLSQARRAAARNLTREEWGQYFSGVPYRETFPDLLRPHEPQWQIVYSTDFSADPGWTTNSPENFYWNEPDGTYHFKMCDIGGRYSYINVPCEFGHHCRLEFDVYMTRCDQKGGLRLGLGDPDMNVVSPATWWVSCNNAFEEQPQQALGYWDSEGGWHNPGSLAPAPLQLNTWYHNVATYDGDLGTLLLEVTKVSDGSLVGVDLLGGVGSFLGIDRLYMSSIGDGRAEGDRGEGYIDNVMLKGSSE